MTTAQRLAALAAGLLNQELPVRIRAWDGSEAGPPEAPTVYLTSRRVLRRLLWRPNELGLAQAYVTGELDVPGQGEALSDGLRRMWQAAARMPTNANTRTRRPWVRSALTAARLGALGRLPAAPSCQARLSGRLHTPTRDRAAIAHHYDLSNEFYALILDESMAYSCAYYPRPGLSLADAQRAKLDLICRKLALRPGQRLLDVGCGWGSLILHAAEHYGVTALGVTLSEQQREIVTKRVADGGLVKQVEVRVQDYRTLDEAPFDAVASIEMGEHVGQANYPAYATALFAQLAPGGRLLLQQMSRCAGAAPGGGAFIETFIAPDMHMRPLPQTLGLLEGAGFEIREVQALREHYVRTVADWLAALEDRYDDVVALVGEQVARVWRLYLVGGGLAFEQDRMGVDQILARRPGPSTESVRGPVARWAKQ